MPASRTLIARDQRILAGYRAGRPLLDLARAKSRRVLSSDRWRQH